MRRSNWTDAVETTTGWPMLQRAIKKPIPITVLRFDGETVPAGVELRVWVSAQDHVNSEVFNRRMQRWMPVAVGDYINATDLQDVYPIAADYFAAHYEVIP